MRRYIETKAQGTLFDKMTRLDELHEMGDPLARLNAVIDWAVFSPILARLPKPEPKEPGGRPPYEAGLMFKVLVIQSLYGLSDHRTQFQITDRLSFKSFLGLSDADKAPDEKTIWAFLEALNAAGLVEPLFAAFGASLESMGLIARKGQMSDASFVEVPRQRNSREENGQIQSGEIPADWAQQPAKSRQKDTDARWIFYYCTIPGWIHGAKKMFCPIWCVVLLLVTLYLAYSLRRTQQEGVKVIRATNMADGITHAVLLAEIERNIDENNPFFAKEKIRSFIRRTLRDYQNSAETEYIADFVKQDAQNFKEQYPRE